MRVQIVGLQWQSRPPRRGRSSVRGDGIDVSIAYSVHHRLITVPAHGRQRARRHLKVWPAPRPQRRRALSLPGSVDLRVARPRRPVQADVCGWRGVSRTPGLGASGETRLSRITRAVGLAAIAASDSIHLRSGERRSSVVSPNRSRCTAPVPELPGSPVPALPRRIVSPTEIPADRRPPRPSPRSGSTRRR